MEPRGGRFGRRDRLRKPWEFRRVSTQGRRAAGSSFVLLWAPSERGASEGRTRLGVTVSRKVGKAVARNRVKRRLREWFRNARVNLGSEVDVVVIARSGAAGRPTANLVAELDRLAGAVRQP